MCIIGNNCNEVDSSEQPQDGTSDSRTRTTTLTHSNINNNTSGNIAFEAHEIPTYEDNKESAAMNFIQQPSNQNRKTFFFSKFSKFNQQCLLNLIGEKDKNEFSNIVKQLEGHHQLTELSTKSGTNSSSSSLLINDVKVYLRFNWYSFNELKYSFNEFNNATTSNAANSGGNFNSISKMILTPNVGAFPFLSSNSNYQNNCLSRKFF